MGRISGLPYLLIGDGKRQSGVVGREGGGDGGIPKDILRERW
jgi:hypothetical protein